VNEDGSVLILDERLNPDEVSIIYKGKEGDHICAGGGVVVSIDMTITPALKLEGQARDLIRGVQQLRKEAGLELQDRITLSLEGADEILMAHKELILQELQADLGKVDGEAKSLSIDGGSIVVRFRKA
jgi:isoleucyl-tRNA synthetase